MNFEEISSSFFAFLSSAPVTQGLINALIIISNLYFINFVYRLWAKRKSKKTDAHKEGVKQEDVVNDYGAGWTDTMSTPALMENEDKIDLYSLPLTPDNASEVVETIDNASTVNGWSDAHDSLLTANFGSKIDWKTEDFPDRRLNKNQSDNFEHLLKKFNSIMASKDKVPVVLPGIDNVIKSAEKKPEKVEFEVGDWVECSGRQYVITKGNNGFIRAHCRDPKKSTEDTQYPACMIGASGCFRLIKRRSDILITKGSTVGNVDDDGEFIAYKVNESSEFKIKLSNDSPCAGWYDREHFYSVPFEFAGEGKVEEEDDIEIEKEVEEVEAIEEIEEAEFVFKYEIGTRFKSNLDNMTYVVVARYKAGGIAKYEFLDKDGVLFTFGQEYIDHNDRFSVIGEENIEEEEDKTRYDFFMEMNKKFGPTDSTLFCKFDQSSKYFFMMELLYSLSTEDNKLINKELLYGERGDILNLLENVSSHLESIINQMDELFWPDYLSKIVVEVRTQISKKIKILMRSFDSKMIKDLQAQYCWILRLEERMLLIEDKTAHDVLNNIPSAKEEVVDSVFNMKREVQNMKREVQNMNIPKDIECLKEDMKILKRKHDSLNHELMKCKNFLIP